MRKLLIAFIVCISTGIANADDVAFDFGFIRMNWPLKVVNATQLYDFEEGAGYPGVETVLFERKGFRLTGGSALTIGDSEAVPFGSIQTRLSDKFFDTSNNELWFGFFVGKRSSLENWSYGLNASIELW